MCKELGSVCLWQIIKTGLNAQFPKGNFTYFIITDGNCMKFYSVKMCLKLLDKYGAKYYMYINSESIKLLSIQGKF